MTTATCRVCLNSRPANAALCLQCLTMQAEGAPCGVVWPKRWKEAG